MKKNILFSIYSSRWGNFIFHKRSVNTKHIKVRLCMNLWRFFVENRYWGHFPCIFLGAPICCHVAETAGLKGKVIRGIIFLPIKSYLFTILPPPPFFGHGFAWYHLQCVCYILIVKYKVFSKNFYKAHRVEAWSCWVKTSINKNNCSSLVFTNLELIFEPCTDNLVWKWGAEDPKKKMTI